MSDLRERMKKIQDLVDEIGGLAYHDDSTTHVEAALRNEIIDFAHAHTLEVSARVPRWTMIEGTRFGEMTLVGDKDGALVHHYAIATVSSHVTQDLKTNNITISEADAVAALKEKFGDEAVEQFMRRLKA